MTITFDSQEMFKALGETWESFKIWCLGVDHSLKLLDTPESREIQYTVAVVMLLLSVGLVTYDAYKKRKARLDAKVTLTQNPLDERQATARRT